MFINPDGQLGTLLPVSAASQTANLLVLMVLLLACVKIPGHLRVRRLPAAGAAAIDRGCGSRSG